MLEIQLIGGQWEKSKIIVIFDIMKRFVFSLLAILAAFPLFAQFNTREEVLADIEKSGGVHYMYPTDQPRPTAAPKGYKPFYVSHLGRHGARFALGSTVYAGQWGIWSRAHEMGWLTPKGEEIYQAWVELIPLVNRREGNLTVKGQEQHRFIASRLFADYPEVFAGPTHASAVSTGVHRVIVSMYAFLGQLDALDKDFSYDSDYGYPYQGYLLPDVIDAANQWPDSVTRKFNRFVADRLDVEGMLGRWFTQPGLLVDRPYTFLDDLHVVVSTLDNLDGTVPQAFYTLFSPEERYRLWEVSNYASYLRLGMSPEVENVRPLAMRALLQDFIGKAEEDISTGTVQLRLRFAHDSTLMPLLSLMGVNNWGSVISDPAALADAWRTFDVPMACNFQWIFFRNPRTPEVLVQVLMNGREATLPLPMAAPGSFYRWEDLKTLIIK